MDRPNKFQFYWCVNCGHTGDFGFERQKNIKCEECSYEDIVNLDQEEYTLYKNQKGVETNVEETIESR